MVLTQPMEDMNKSVEATEKTTEIGESIQNGSAERKSGVAKERERETELRKCDAGAIRGVVVFEGQVKILQGNRSS